MNSPPDEGASHKALYWHPEGDGLLCDLCPRRCLIADGALGYCGTRMNRSGTMDAVNYGKVCASALDSIEKKPIFHFLPGARLYSVGTFGCNLDCANCQNAVLARAGEADAPYVRAAPEELAQAALDQGAQGVAFTFNEPSVWIEFILDTSQELHRRGLFALVNTNGYIEPWAADDLYEAVDVANIDVKGFTEGFYRQNCGGKLEPVLETCEIAQEADVHIELTYLLIPGMNDSAREVRSFCEWMVDTLGPDVPLHIFRFMPAYKLAHLEPASMQKLAEAYSVADEAGLRYVYYAGVIGDERQDTYCPKCGQLVIARQSRGATEKVFVRKEQMSRFCPSYARVEVLLKDGKCPKCGAAIPVIAVHRNH